VYIFFLQAFGNINFMHGLNCFMYCAWLWFGNNVVFLDQIIFQFYMLPELKSKFRVARLEIWIFMAISYYVTDNFKALFCSGEMTLWISMCKCISLTWIISMKRDIIPIILFHVTFWEMGLDTLLSSSICTFYINPFCFLYFQFNTYDSIFLVSVLFLLLMNITDRRTYVYFRY